MGYANKEQKQRAADRDVEPCDKRRKPGADRERRTWGMEKVSRTTTGRSGQDAGGGAGGKRQTNRFGGHAFRRQEGGEKWR